MTKIQFASVVKTYLSVQDWEVLFHRLYAPNIHSSFKLPLVPIYAVSPWRLAKISFFDTKEVDLFRQEIRKLPEKWAAEVVTTDGVYFT